MSTEKHRKRLSREKRRELIEAAATEVFAAHGYRGSSMEEIARRSGITPPVLYDHFPSKLELHRRLLERTRNELLEMWREHLFGDDAPASVRFPHAIEAWATYIEKHPYAARMYFRGGAGDAEAEAVHREIQDQARVALGVLLAREPGVEQIAGPGQEELEMSAELIRSALAGLAMWWSDHPHVPRAQIVRTAVNVLWRGLERVRDPSTASLVDTHPDPVRPGEMTPDS